MTAALLPDIDAIDEVKRLNSEYRSENGRRRLARVITFGCKMNENDSEKIMGLLSDMDFEIEPSPPSGKYGNPAPLGALGNYGDDSDRDIVRRPDLVVLNTCCVRENAEKRLFGILGSLKKFKMDDKSRILAVCGCMTQQESAVSFMRAKHPYVDFAFGTKRISALPSLLRDAYLSPRPYPISAPPRKAAPIPVSNDLAGEGPEDWLPMYRKAPPLALVSVMNGCDNFCSYCVVPFVRGREQSRAPESVEREVVRLARDGYREITLLGQNVNSYGGDLRNGGCDFAGLLERLSGIDGISRIRFMTSHPKDLSDRLIGAIRDLDAVCPHIHLPVQSGSTEVLRKMNRGYGREDYLKLVRKLRFAVPHITLTTDVIVGFPGESEHDFNDTMSLVEEAAFDLAYTFLFSPRRGTAAAEYTDAIPADIVKNRFNRLLALQNRISYEKNRAAVGAAVMVLCEGLSKTNADRYTGRTPGGKVVNFRLESHGGAGAVNNKDLTGRIVEVLVEEARTWSLDGAAKLE
jgi:tRNA-2-methylthio-N6-dimethylallyladenosine synthase